MRGDFGTVILVLIATNGRHESEAFGTGPLARMEWAEWAMAEVLGWCVLYEIMSNCSTVAVWHVVMIWRLPVLLCIEA